ncbi:MAG: hypothetical protein ACLPKW_26260 [Acetobacteraceae bacterium]
MGGLVRFGLAFLGTGLLGRWLVGVRPLDPVAFLSSGLVVGAAVTLACYGPARRVFRMAGDATRYYTRHVVRKTWDAIAKAAGLPTGQRFGWHSLRRKFATELKAIPLKDLSNLGGWKSAATILACYQSPDEATQRTALAQRKLLTMSGLS